MWYAENVLLMYWIDMEKTEAIHSAARTGKIEVVKRLLECEESFFVKDSKGNYPVFVAMSNGHVSCVKIFVEAALLKNYNPLKAWPCKWRTLLTYAAHGGYFDSIKLLFDMCYEHISQLNFKETHEIVVESARHPKALEFLMEKLYDLNWNLDNAFSYYGLLISAAEKKCQESMKILIYKGIDVNRQLDVYSFSFQNHSMFHYDMPLLQVIQTLIVDLNYDINKINIHRVVDYTLESEMEIIDILRFLIERGADVNVCVPSTGAIYYLFPPHTKLEVSPIFRCAITGKLEVLKYLIKVTDQDTLGQLKATSPVFAAIQYHKVKCLKELLSSGYSVDGQLACHEVFNRPGFCGGPMFHTMEDSWGKCSVEDMVTLLEILMKSNLKLTPEFIDLSYFETYLRDPTPGYDKVIRLLIQHGIIEHFFGYETGIQDFAARVALFCAESFDEDDEKLYVLKNLGLLMDYLSVFKITIGPLDLYLAHCEYNVIPLMQLCRREVRCLVFSENENTLPIKDLPIPVSLVKYLMFEEAD